MRRLSLTFVLVCSFAFAQKPQQLISVPAAGVGVEQGTYPFAISARGLVVGSYVDASNNSHGFTWTQQAGLATFDAFGATAKSTSAYGVNVNGQMVGTFTPVKPSFNGQSFGFLSFRGGTYTLIQAAQGTQIVTQAFALNDSGTATGTWTDLSDHTHGYNGFVRSPQGEIISFTAASDSTSDIALAINNAGTIAGYYAGENGQRGFIRDSSGAITVFNAPGAAATFAYSINASGQVAGYYIDTSNIPHGFIRNTDGTFTTFTVQFAIAMTGAAQAGAIHIVSLNDAGETAGQAVLPGGMQVAWTRSPTGVMRVFQVCGQSGIAALNNLGNYAGFCGGVGEMVSFEGFVL